MPIIYMAARIPRAREESAQIFSGQKDILVSLEERRWHEQTKQCSDFTFPLLHLRSSKPARMSLWPEKSARNPRGHVNYWHGSGLNRKRM